MKVFNRLLYFVFAFTLLQTMNAQNTFVDTLCEFFVDTEYLEENELALNLFPNPAINNVTLELESDTQNELSLEIVNANGRLVYETNTQQHVGMNRWELQFDNWYTGVYFVRLSSKGNIATRKLVIAPNY